MSFNRQKIAEKKKIVSIFQKLIGNSFRFSIESLKKEIGGSPGNSILYKTIGSIYENSGILRTALKFYLIFSKTKAASWSHQARISLMCFWYQFYQQISDNFLTIGMGQKPLSIEVKCFLGKYLEKNGNFSQAGALWKKLSQEKMKTISKKKITDFPVLYWSGFWVRSVVKGLVFNLDNWQLKKLIRILGNLNKKRIKNKSQILIGFLELQIKYKIRKLFSEMFIKRISFDKFFREPLIVSVFQFFFLEFNENIIRNRQIKIARYLGVYIKWFIYFGDNFLQRKLNFLNFLESKGVFRNPFPSYQSFNPLFRNKKLRSRFFSKIIEAQQLKGLHSSVLEIYRFKVTEQLDERKTIEVLTKIQKKLKFKKKAKDMFLRGIKMNIKKSLGNLEKNKKRIIVPKKILILIDNFFQENKLFALSRLVASVFLLDSRIIFKTVDLNGKCSLDFKKNEYSDIFKKYPEKSKEFLSRLESKTKENFSSSIQKLFEHILLFILKNKKRLKEKTLEILFSNLPVFKNGTEAQRFLSIFFLIERKKLNKAYNFLRIQCLSEPTSLEGWYLLGKIEKEIGVIVSKTLRYSIRILIKSPESVPGIVFTGNHCSVFGSYGYALAEYFQAYRWKKNSPFLNFIIFLQYLNGSFNRRNYHSGFAIFLSLCFLEQYRNLRSFTSQTQLQRNDLSILLETEITFNKGRLYLFLGINYLALKCFRKSLRKGDKIITLNKLKRCPKAFAIHSLNKEAVYNIYLFNLCFGRKRFNDVIF